MIGKPHNHFAAAVCTVQPLAVARCLEVVTWRAPTAEALGPHWPLRPGQALHTGARTRVLYFAPRRWLVIEPDAETADHIDGYVSAGIAACVDVTGKWRELNVSGPGAAYLLARTIDVECVLHERGCAAVTLFDCPAIIITTADGFLIWVHASYEAGLMGSLQRLLRRE